MNLGVSPFGRKTQPNGETLSVTYECMNFLIYGKPCIGPGHFLSPVVFQPQLHGVRDRSKEYLSLSSMDVLKGG
jgi:hypothetical protein